jgi:hypothetical protein
MDSKWIMLAVLAAFVGPRAGSAAEPADVIIWVGKGAQVYTCQSAKNGYAWTFKQPDAQLTDSEGQVRAHHGAGPSWTAADGSRIIGEVVATIPAPRPDSIPWLVLLAKQHEGQGILERVTYVLRTETLGGTAPAVGCDQQHDGIVARVPYQATYSFLNPVSQSASPPLTTSSRG